MKGIFRTDDPELEALAASEWADFPQTEIPADWRDRAPEKPRPLAEVHIDTFIPRASHTVRLNGKWKRKKMNDQWLRQRQA